MSRISTQLRLFSTMQIDLGPIRTFQEKNVPAGTRLAGWSALVQSFGLRVPVRRTCAVSEQHIRGSRREERDWTVFDKRYWPGDDFASHLGFALRHEAVDPLILKRLFEAVPADAVQQFVAGALTGQASRRGWFWYEFLTGRTLDLPELPPLAAIDLLDTKAYFTGSPRLSSRHKVRDNLLGTARFCPIIRRTKPLQEAIARQLGDRKSTRLNS